MRKMPALTAAALRREASGAPEALKPRKFKPGTRAIMEIRKMQRTAGLLMRKAPFARLCKEASELFSDDYRCVYVARACGRCGAVLTEGMCRFRVDAIQALQTAAEAYLVALFQDACLCAIHAKRCTVNTIDVHLAERIRAHHQPWQVTGISGVMEEATKRTVEDLLPRR